MTSQEFGALIRARREANKMTVEEIAARIKVSARTLRAMEEGIVDGMPHAVYARSFIRSYAACSGVTPEEINEGLDVLFPQEHNEDEGTQPGPVGRQRNAEKRRGAGKAAAVVTLAVLLVVFAGLGWLLFDRYGGVMLTFIKKPFSAAGSSSRENVTLGISVKNSTVVAPQAAPAIAAVPEPAQPAHDTAAASVAANATTPASVAAPSPHAVINATSPALVVIPSRNATRSTAANATAPAVTRLAEPVVAVLAKGNCWVQTVTDGEKIRTINMSAGESAVFPFGQKLVLTLGNAGGVEVSYNGMAFPVNGRQDEKKTLTFPPRP